MVEHLVRVVAFVAFLAEWPNSGASAHGCDIIVDVYKWLTLVWVSETEVLAIQNSFPPSFIFIFLFCDLYDIPHLREIEIV